MNNPSWVVLSSTIRLPHVHTRPGFVDKRVGRGIRQLVGCMGQRNRHSWCDWWDGIRGVYTLQRGSLSSDHICVLRLTLANRLDMRDEYRGDNSSRSYVAGMDIKRDRR